MSAPSIHFLHNTTITNSGTQYTVEFGQQASVHIIGISMVLDSDVPSGVNVNGIVKVPGFVYSGSSIGATYGKSFFFNTWLPSLSGESNPYTLWGDLDIFLPPGSLNLSVMLPSYATGVSSVVIVIAN